MLPTLPSRLVRRRCRRVIAVLAAVALLPLAAPPLGAASLRPSRASLERQIAAAREHHFEYVTTPAQVLDLVARGLLVEVPGDGDYVVKDDLPFPYARPAVKTFLERFGRAFAATCGVPLVVTSLVRPRDRQPRNASPLSVHPTGMAMDLRLASGRSCRRWLEARLLDLEDKGVLEAARERSPPHYHVVLFPREYQAYLSHPEPADGPRLAAASAAGGFHPRASSPAYLLRLPSDATGAQASPGGYRVRPGDTLWTIARRFGTTVAILQALNGLSNTTIERGQTLEVPAR